MLDFFYRLIDILLPFQWASHTFMKNAFLAILLITPLFGLLGTMIVSNRMAFFSDSIGHSSFTGIALGSLLGFIAPMWGAILFSIIFAVIITIIKNKSKAAPDTIIGVFSSIAIALGLVILSLGGSFNKYSSYLVGDILSITPAEIALVAAIFLFIILLWTVIFNELLLVSINHSLAGSRRINVSLVEMMFTSTIAIVVTISIGWVGLLIINSLLVLPAAAARNISKNVRQYTLFSVLLALLSGVGGLIASYYFNTATGATIVLIAGAAFFVTLALKNKFK